MTDTTTTPRATPSIGLTLRSLLAADTQVILRSRQTLLLNLLMPIVILVLTDRAGRGSGAAAGTQFGDAGFLIAMALTYGLLSSSLMGYSITIARDREAGVFQRLRVAPAPTWAIMSSRLIVQFAAAIATSIIVIVVGSILHGVSYGAGSYVLIFLVAVLGAAMFLGIGQALVGLVRSTTVVNAVGRVLYIVLILLGLLGASGLLGDTIKSIADWSPVGALITLFVAVTQLAAWTWSDTGALLACVGYLVVFAGIGIRWFKWDPR